MIGTIEWTNSIVHLAECSGGFFCSKFFLSGSKLLSVGCGNKDFQLQGFWGGILVSWNVQRLIGWYLSIVRSKKTSGTGLKLPTSIQTFIQTHQRHTLEITSRHTMHTHSDKVFAAHRPSEIRDFSLDYQHLPRGCEKWHPWPSILAPRKEGAGIWNIYFYIIISYNFLETSGFLWKLNG